MEKAEVRTWLAVGGLLHDIGKLIDRAEEVRAEEEEKGQFGYAHAVYSYKFLKELLEGKVSKEVEELILSGSYHHKPKPGNLYHLAQHIADLCASSERSLREDIETRKEEKRLKSIFDLVSLEETQKLDKYEYQLRCLELRKDVIFPTEIGKNRETEGKEEYEALLDSLKERLKQLDFRDGHKTLTKLYHLLYKYLWCVPASTYDRERGTKHYPDISLFDHLRVASALASSLWTDYNKGKMQEVENKSVEEKKEAVEFLLVEGDITGIQRFLYQLSNTKGVEIGRASCRERV